MSEIPQLTKGKSGYEGFIELNAWAVFQVGNDSEEPLDGSCRVSIIGKDHEILDSHIQAFSYLKEHQYKIKDLLLQRLLSDYSDLQKSYGYDDEEKLKYMPDVHQINEFQNLIELTNIHLMNVEKEGVAYVGYELDCSWDDEHGIGFMTHKKEIIDFGGADTSFLTWIAERDIAGIKPERETNSKKNIEPKRKKPWWKIW